MPRMGLRRDEDVLAEDLVKNPEFKAYWERTVLARAVALAVLHYRTEHGLSQTALGRLLGVPQPHVSRLELGEHSPTLEMLQRLARVLGLRFIVEVAPADKSSAEPLLMPAGVSVVEDLTTSDGSRVRVAAG